MFSEFIDFQMIKYIFIIKMKVEYNTEIKNINL